ncbi:MAG: outer membrane protein assembly factor BamD [Pseudodesulfovibrio sp.]|uniref:Outer membrane assembly lipoprotein YfiO n=1 Tax=Pseudodesulfovibrio aespoeensis (strain ATCC 700646 / DSM 10631 / Aspo-2) TaxID=643562 RepID=E6VZ58_PSEA9|nr:MULTISPECIES: outer membrane protein assembly factor BamD [Pseudodesulfovibrio]MBU4192346.1 outer membrane protein assembly factor BamD [Pseudomonadota bacterium]ADU62834.1 outer membrane assembly lipoprotein YfiO [Pseudodesulfovibrio aespoeensis Aspo-2]MBU4245266.1 outer membrane protein assembly factor BamD [Pseudomonadota bacterium]MBU4380155.1 outer membrane protein assembly factor BamD [Pseudomonadota bacterium]MBU4474595.1 outer membrane protein assembly factor BamD [Pseudomonadota ba
MRSSRLVASFLFLWLASGCALIDSYFLPPPEDTAQELYEAGMDAMGNKEYGDAQQYFSKLKDRFPFSPFALRAELALGDAYFLDADYLMALDSYKEFEALHPSHESIPYVLYQIGSADFNLFRSIDRRQENIQEGLEYFYRLRETYPDSEYATASEDMITKGRRILAEHEVYVADFFWRTEQYGPAWNRYQYVVENFSDVPDLRDYARKRAEYSYFEYQKTLSEEERLRIQGSWKLWLKKWL